MCFNSVKIPYKEQEPQYNNTIIISDIVESWLTTYEVIDKEYWRNHVMYNFTNNINVIAQAYTLGEIHQIDIKTEYFNIGVLAHEHAHHSYGLLSDEEKQSFQNDFGTLRKTDKYIKKLVKNHDCSKIIEAHAECYRYIGQYMNNALKKYYPKLL
jgi:hypothetical protein